MSKGTSISFEPYMIDNEIQVNIFDAEGTKIAFYFFHVGRTDAIVGSILDAKDRVVNRDKYEIERLQLKLTELEVKREELMVETNIIKASMRKLARTKDEKAVRPRSKRSKAKPR